MHRECGRYMAEHGVHMVLGVRGNAKSLVEGARDGGTEAEFVETPEAAGEWLAKKLQKDDAVLVKASRGVRLEKAFEILKSKFAEEK